MASLNDRVEGVLLGTAAGDALGAPYEFQPPRGPELPVEMTGGGPWEAGEWTDDTAMAIAVAEVAATGADLRHEAPQDLIAKRWFEWSRGAKDIGIQTRSVLTRCGGASAASARVAALEVHRCGPVLSAQSPGRFRGPAARNPPVSSGELFAIGPVPIERAV